MPILWKIPNLSEAVSKNLKDHVQKISQKFYPRSTFHLKQLNQTADYIRETWENYGLEVFEHRFAVPATSDTLYRNIHTRFPPRQDAKNNFPLIIGAHYDAAGTTPGADDNASGVAGLLELARLLSESAKASGLQIPVELVAYTNEESPFFGTPYMGAYQHAKKIIDQKEKILGMISLEMIGYYSEEKGSQNFPLPLMNVFYPDQGNFIAFVSTFQSFSLVRKTKRAFADHCSFPLEWFVGPARIRGLISSDHYAFLLHNLPAMMITDTAYFRNPNYHTPNDLPETLNYKAMAEVVTGIYHMLLHWQG
jgi:hypothetical protein